MALARAALVDPNNIVQSVIIVDTEVPYVVPPGLTAYPIPRSSPVSPGWTLNGQTWVPPVQAEVVPEIAEAEDTTLELEVTQGDVFANLNKARSFSLSPTGACNLFFTNIPMDGRSCRVVVVITQHVPAYNIVWPPGTSWVGDPVVPEDGVMTSVAFTKHNRSWLATESV